jgi:hypothetical protein
MGQSVTCGSVTGNTFSEQGTPEAILPRFRKKPLNPPMLITQLYLQMQDFLTIADKPEMTGLNHAGMNRSYSNLMKHLAFHFIKRISAYHIPPVGPVMRISHGLKPGMAFKAQTVSFMYFTFKYMHGRT